MISEKEIYEKFAEFAGIQEFDQQQGNFSGTQQALTFTRDWLMEEGFDRNKANTMIYRARRRYENN